MGVAIDTLSGHVTNSVALTVVTPSVGDNFIGRSFPQASKARITQLLVKQATLGTVQLRSPAFHDNVRGIQYKPGAAGPATFLLPAEASQPMVSGDFLTASLTSGAADSSRLAVGVYYDNLPGITARLARWQDIAGNIKSIKPLEVVSAASVIASWTDTVITTTEDLLHANTDYAVLGYVTSAAVLACGVKGQETGNLRVCGPGTTDSLDTSDYFVAMANQHQIPHIPIINANNKGSVFASIADNTAGAVPSVQLILAEMANPVGI